MSQIRTAKVLRKTAEFYERNPDAFAKGRYLASVVAEHAEYLGEGASDSVGAVREAIGMSEVPGALTVWSKKHTPAQAAEFLKNVAAYLEREAA